MVGNDRVLFMLKDGSKAWDIKDFLVTQDRCEMVTIEGKDYPGKGASDKTVLSYNWLALSKIIHMASPVIKLIETLQC